MQYVSASDVVLLGVAVLFAWNLGAHYTGATMGMPYASRSIALWPALAIVAIFSLLGASFASGKVERTVGLHLIAARHHSVAVAIVIVACAGTLTMAFNYLRLPTSTIQILVFCVLGVGLGAGLRIHWATLPKLVGVWLVAPLLAAAIAFALTRLLDRLVPPPLAAQQTRAQLEGPRRSLPRTAKHASLVVALPWLLVVVGVCASFVLGANDVANATGALLLAHQFSAQAAGAIGGGGMFLGALMWGRRILDRVAFDIVKLDLTMASAAQAVQALVVIVAVSQGVFTSMNQALIGAMAGTGLARGWQTVDRQQLRGVVRGWVIGPAAGLALGYITARLAL